MEKSNKLKKRYFIGGIALILLQILMMCTVLSDKDSNDRQTLTYELINNKLTNNVLVHPREAGIHAKGITIISIGLIGIGYLLLIKEEWEKRKAINKEDWYKKSKG